MGVGARLIPETSERPPFRSPGWGSERRGIPKGEVSLHTAAHPCPAPATPCSVSVENSENPRAELFPCGSCSRCFWAEGSSGPLPFPGRQVCPPAAQAMPGAEPACTPVCSVPGAVLTYSIVLVSLPEPAHHPAVPSTAARSWPWNW